MIHSPSNCKYSWVSFQKSYSSSSGCWTLMNTTWQKKDLRFSGWDAAPPPASSLFIMFNSCLFLSLVCEKRDQVWPRIVTVWSQFLPPLVAFPVPSSSWHGCLSNPQKHAAVFLLWLSLCSCKYRMLLCSEINLSTAAVFPIPLQSSLSLAFTVELLMVVMTVLSEQKVWD